MLTARSGSPVDSPNVIEIRALAPDDDATAFRTLNEEWIRDISLFKRKIERL